MWPLGRRLNSVTFCCAFLRLNQTAPLCLLLSSSLACVFDGVLVTNCPTACQRDAWVSLPRTRKRDTSLNSVLVEAIRCSLIEQQRRFWSQKEGQPVEESFTWLLAKLPMTLPACTLQCGTNGIRQARRFLEFLASFFAIFLWWPLCIPEPNQEVAQVPPPRNFHE